MTINAIWRSCASPFRRNSLKGSWRKVCSSTHGKFRVGVSSNVRWQSGHARAFIVRDWRPWRWLHPTIVRKNLRPESAAELDFVRLCSVPRVEGFNYLTVLKRLHQRRFFQRLEAGAEARDGRRQEGSEDETDPEEEFQTRSFRIRKAPSTNKK